MSSSDLNNDIDWRTRNPDVNLLSPGLPYETKWFLSQVTMESSITTTLFPSRTPHDEIEKESGFGCLGKKMELWSALVWKQELGGETIIQEGLDFGEACSDAHMERERKREREMDGGGDQSGEAQKQKGGISNIVIIIAMQSEALPLVDRFHLSEDPHSPFPQGVPWVRYHGSYKDLTINLIWPGKDPALGVDSAKGASVGDIFIISDCAFHDRRIPIPVFDLYGVGLRKAFETPNLVKELNLQVAKLSTGDSLDMTQQDESSIISNDATVKDMEGAAVAYVAELLKVPAIFVKAVTDIVDGDKPTAEEFLQNLAAVTAALDVAVEKVISFINGKSLSEL
ncbi:Mutanase [Stylosanthes scabra]|uniref:Mutanase n=1 Tax=Stylosanthes scabra TaxID=79078 RepID=A0ABU6Y2S4_9FABA|nr:Mutanase [Stylosanthes scabra]